MLGKGLESLIPKKESTAHVAKSKEQQSDGASPFVPVLASPRSPASSSASVPHTSAWPHREEFQKKIAASSVEASRPSRHAPSGAGKRETAGSVFQIEVEKIKPNPYQPRREFGDDELHELAASIRQFGVIQPLVVSKITKETPTGTDVEYQLVAGERRLMAAKIAGLERVPAIVRVIASHQTKLEIALIENIQRSDLNPLEAARAYARLQEEFGLTQREIASRIGKSREVIANTIRLLNLPAPIQDALSRGAISESQARALLSFPTSHEQFQAFSELISTKRSVREIREKAADQKTKLEDPDRAYWERKLEDELGTPVQVVKRGGQGKLSIQFYSDAEWQNVLNRLLGPESR